MAREGAKNSEEGGRAEGVASDPNVSTEMANYFQKRILQSGQIFQNR
jgi:hypothetical protein